MHPEEKKCLADKKAQSYPGVTNQLKQFFAGYSLSSPEQKFSLINANLNAAKKELARVTTEGLVSILNLNNVHLLLDPNIDQIDANLEEQHKLEAPTKATATTLKNAVNTRLSQTIILDSSYPSHSSSFSFKSGS